MSNSDQSKSQAFELLDDKIKKWIWKQGWEELHEIQEQAIPAIFDQKGDLIIASPTASGKTEAAILPILSKAIYQEEVGIFALYIAPLKALINDQYSRFQSIAKETEIKITPWHGDVSSSKKRNLLNSPSGVLLITPESLESLFINHGSELKVLFNELNYIIIDELHSFIGDERGRHLKSLISRIELILKRKVFRIGLSATIGDKNLAKLFLRNTDEKNIKYIDSDSIQSDLKLQIRGYLNKDPSNTEPAEENDNQALGYADLRIAHHIFEKLRGSDNLIFANSRMNVEAYADKLREMSSDLKVPNEFWPHHGSLSKDIRETVESELKKSNRPSSAVCTSTLEMGIDIGTVDSIAQIGTPPSVSSMRQRLGRSGRRGNPAVFRIYLREEEITAQTAPQDRLRTSLVQSIAMVELLIKKWFEPPNLTRLHLSTLIHQILSLIGQYGGVRAMDAWQILFEMGPFDGISKKQFAELLRNLGKENIIVQANDKTITLGVKGEHILDHYSFYAAFNTPEEYKILADGRSLGTLPVLFPLIPGTYIIFAGKRWIINSVDEEKKLIILSHSSGGKPPMFGGGGIEIHDKIRERMLEIYNSKLIPNYINDEAKQLLVEGREYFQNYNLDKTNAVLNGNDIVLFIWKGTIVQNTIFLLLLNKGLNVGIENTSVLIRDTSLEYLVSIVEEIVSSSPPKPFELVENVQNKENEKFDYLLTEELLSKEYYHRFVSIESALDYLRDFLKNNDLATR